MMAKPIRTLELHYPIIQFLVKTVISLIKEIISCVPIFLAHESEKYFYCRNY